MMSRVPWKSQTNPISSTCLAFKQPSSGVTNFYALSTGPYQILVPCYGVQSEPASTVTVPSNRGGLFFTPPLASSLERSYINMHVRGLCRRQLIHITFRREACDCTNLCSGLSRRFIDIAFFVLLSQHIAASSSQPARRFQPHPMSIHTCTNMGTPFLSVLERLPAPLN